MNRTDGVIWASVYGCQGKAVASAVFARPSGQLTERSEHPTLRGIVAAEGGDMMLGRGAVLIILDGMIAGAYGGGTSQQDKDGARAGVDSL